MATTYDCGHGCTITCPDGGGCVYHKESGRCTTFCNDDLGKLEYKGKGTFKEFSDCIRESDTVDITFNNVTLSEISRLLESIKG